MMAGSTIRNSFLLLSVSICISQSSEQNQFIKTNEIYWTNDVETGHAQVFRNEHDFVDGSGEPTTETSQVCPSGRFGLDCAYRCYCKDPNDICDPVYGNCSSGCHTGWYGPGCIVEDRHETIAIVVALSILLVLSLVLCFVLCLYVISNIIDNEKNKFRRLTDSPAGGGISYGQSINVAGLKSSGQTSNKIKTTIPRIRETDIQVMNDVVGKGKFGNINRGFIKKGNRNTEVAFKILHESALEDDRSSFSAQLELYSSIGQHENVIKFYGVCAVGGQIYAAFEFASHGNLKNFLRNYSVPESQRETSPSRMSFDSKTTPLQFALDVANGMMYLSSKQIVHGKLCAKHVLLGSKYTAKISGLKPRNGISQIIRWTAPEAMHEMKYSTQGDVWSFGVLLWEIVTFGSKPYSDISTGDLYSHLSDGYRMPQPDGVDDKTYNLMKSCWQSKPDDRPSFNTLSAKLREMVASLEFQASMDSIDDIDLDIDEDLDLGSGRRFGRIAFDNSAFDIET